MSTAPLPSSGSSGRPFLIKNRPAGRSSRSPLELWHLLSLDAPTVAATWTAFVAWCAGVPFKRLDPVAMFVAVWILYAADRLLDAQPLFTSPAVAHLEERHRFHHRYRKRFLQTILLACIPLVLLLHKTADVVLHLYILLAILLGVWLLLVHARSAPSAQQHRLPKEIAVSLFFPAAVFIPTVARAPALRLALLPSACCFGVVCFLNCLFLYGWEHPRDGSYAHASTRWAVRHVKALALCFTLMAILLYFLTRHMQGGHALRHAGAAPLACGVACALLLTLHAARDRIGKLSLRALADLALLTPIPLALILHRR